MPSSILPENPHNTTWYWNLLAILIAGIAAFYFLFNGIPLIDWGFADFEVTKKVCIKIMRFSVLLLFIPFAIWCWRWPVNFKKLWLVRFGRAILNLPLYGIISLLFIIYTLVLLNVGFERHFAIETRGFDLGIFVQAIWNTLQGDLLYSSIKNGINLMGDHVAPLLIFLTPFYKIWPSPLSLITLQAICAGACIFPITYLARLIFKDDKIALVWGLAYFFYFPVRAALHEDFHPEVLVEFFFLLAFIALEKRRTFLFILSMLIAATAKENMLGITFILGFYAAVFKKRWVLGAMVMIASLSLFIFELKWVVPYFRGEAHEYSGLYAPVFKSFPLGFLKAVFNPDSLEYMAKVYLPMMFLSLLHLPTLILTFPILAQNVLSSNELMRSFNYHYLTGMNPFVFISAMYGMKFVYEKIPFFDKRKGLFCFIFLFVVMLRSGPSEYFYLYDTQSHRTPHVDHVREKLRTVPEEYAVLTHNVFIPQLAHRKQIQQFPYNARPTKTQMALKWGADVVIFDKSFWEHNARDIKTELNALLNAGFAITYEKDGFYILKKL